MNERNNKTRKEYRIEPYPRHIIINKIQNQSQIGIYNNNLSSIQTSVTDYTKNDQSISSLLGQKNTDQFKKCSKDYFTPRQIYLWVKILELIVHLSKDLNEKLNSDFISIKWINHRDKIRFQAF